MKKIYLPIVLVLFLTACSSKSQHDTNNNLAAETTQNGIASISDGDTIYVFGNDPDCKNDLVETEQLPEAYTRYNLDMLDTTSMLVSISDNESISLTQDSDIYSAAFNVGATFAAVAISDTTLKHIAVNVSKNLGIGINNEESMSQTSLFSNILRKIEQNGNQSSAAIMVSGKYFKTLQICAQNNRNEALLKNGVDGLDNLTAYINEAMQSNHDVNTNLLLQKIVDKINLCRTLYIKCNEENSASVDKYRTLADTLSVIHKSLFVKSM